MPPSRFLFRMTHYKNLQTYLAAGQLYAKSSPSVQSGYRISFESIDSKRGTPQFTTPCGSNVNDFVPFYFSPSTKMAYSIHMRNVPQRDPDGTSPGKVSMDDIAQLVVIPEVLFNSGRQCWFTDIACNSGIPPTYACDPNELSSHLEWALFDEFGNNNRDQMATIPEIGYDGVCKWQHDKDEPARYQMRSKKRMAEFLVKDRLQMNEVSCIVLKNQTHLAEVQAWVNASNTQIPVYVKPGCFF